MKSHLLGEKCPNCRKEIHQSSVSCQYCHAPLDFPNMRAARRSRLHLARRYHQACRDLDSRGLQRLRRRFEEHVQRRAQIVTNKGASEILRLLENEKSLSASYYKQIAAGVRVPDTDKWDVFRRRADDTLFPNYREDIVFGALTTDGYGIRNYGEYSLELFNTATRRASLFTRNSASFYRDSSATGDKQIHQALGHRAMWRHRQELCVAKLADRLNPTVRVADFPALLLSNGESSEYDEFVEVHLWRGFSRPDIERISVRLRPTSSVALSREIEQLSRRHRIRFRRADKSRKVQ